MEAVGRGGGRRARRGTRRGATRRRRRGGGGSWDLRVGTRRKRKTTTRSSSASPLLRATVRGRGAGSNGWRGWCGYEGGAAGRGRGRLGADPLTSGLYLCVTAMWDPFPSGPHGSNSMVEGAMAEDLIPPPARSGGRCNGNGTGTLGVSWWWWSKWGLA